MGVFYLILLIQCFFYSLFVCFDISDVCLGNLVGFVWTELWLVIGVGAQLYVRHLCVDNLQETGTVRETKGTLAFFIC